MVEKIGNNSVIDTLQKGLNIISKRQSLIASNIANQDTPAYRSKDIDFKKSLQNAMGKEDNEELYLVTTDNKHISINDPDDTIKIITDDSQSVGNDENTVNIDLEIVKMQENSTRYSMNMELLKHKFMSIKNVLENEK